MKALLVLDDRVSLLVLRTLLERRGIEYAECVSVREALETRDLSGFAAVISDWELPDGEGLDLCRRLRERRGDAYTYFILLTARAPTEENLRRAEEAQVDDFLAKPLDAPVLLSRLRVAARILDYRREIGELRKLLPLCMYCKKIRDDNHYWERMEKYLQTMGVEVTHSICPTCYESQVRPQLDELKPGSSAHLYPQGPLPPPSPPSG